MASFTYGFCSTYIVVDLGVHMQLIKTWVQHIIYDYSTEVFNPLRCFQVPSDLTLTQTLTIQAASWVILKWNVGRTTSSHSEIGWERSTLFWS